MLKFLILTCLLAGLSCQTSEISFDPEKARQEILALHHAQRDYHFQKKAREFIDQLSENHISANRGEVKSLSTEEHLQRFQSYFDQVEFIKWDDTRPPVIRFSDDGSLAYTIVEKDLLLTYVDQKQRTIEEYTKFAWVAIYKKYGDEWKIDCVASTDQPPVAYLSPKAMVQNISSKANCTGPRGKYTTEMQSTPDGYLLFRQSFDYKSDDFHAVIFNDSTAFSLNSDQRPEKPLSDPVIEILRGHDFHMMAIHPERYFSDIEQSGRDSLRGEIFDLCKASDRFKNPIQLYKDMHYGRLTGIVIKNPVRPEQEIEVSYRNWKDTDYGPMADQVEIVQNVIDSSGTRKDTFRFDFYEIQINDANFKKIEL